MDKAKPTLVDLHWLVSILLGGSWLERRFADWMDARDIRGWKRPNVRATVGAHAEGR